MDRALAARVAYARAFGQIFWAFPFFFDFRVKGLDLLPDIFGYMLILTASTTLVRLHTHGRWIQNATFVLLPIGLLDLFEHSLAPFRLGGSERAAEIAFGLGHGVLDAVLVWLLCQVVAELAHHLAAYRVERNAILRRELYVGLVAYLVGAALFDATGPSVSSNTAMLIVIAGLFFAIVVLALLMDLMKQVQDMLQGPSWPSDKAGAEATTATA